MSKRKSTSPPLTVPSDGEPADGFTRSTSPPNDDGPRDLAERTRRIIEAAGERLDPDAVLLSGGLDSTIAAATASGLWTPAVCVLAPKGTDAGYAERAADHAGLTLHRLHLDLEEVLGHVPAVTRILGTFDPMEVRNAVVQYVGLRRARALDARCVLTGDGADELFAGYGYMTRMTPGELRDYQEHLFDRMWFSADELARALDMETVSPFRSDEVRELVLQIEPEHLVREVEGQRWGKWILREAFRSELPGELVWQRKDPLEQGAGTEQLPELLEAQMGPETSKAQRARISEEDSVQLRDAEHLTYYQAYRRSKPPPRENEPGAEDRCEACQGPLPPGQTYCRICGTANERPDASPTP